MFEFKFPEGFYLGTANSAFQCEGAWDRDGRTESVMDHYAKEMAGKIIPHPFNGKSTQSYNGIYPLTKELPDNGCFFYDNYEAYIEDMAKTGQTMYRLSISWNRIIPDLSGEVNQKGIDFYNRVFDKMKECHIEPFVDLLHWDLPQYIMDEGGYCSEKFPEWFENYAKVCFEAFGDRVKYWSTFNETCNSVMMAYRAGRFAPFEKDFKKALLGSHHVILAHYRAVRLYHRMNLGGVIGVVNAEEPSIPDTLTPEDIGAAERASLIRFDWWAGTELEGKYPQRILDECPKFRDNMPPHYQEDLDTWFEKCDFMGVNFYFTERIAYSDDGELFETKVPGQYGSTETKFDHYPAAMIDALTYVSKRYGNIPMFISENGIGIIDHHDIEKDCDDQLRVDFLREHLRNVVRLCRLGVNLKGYLYWNDADSYEAMTGYDHRFGMTYVDHETGERRWKKSRYYFSDICKKMMVD